MGGWLSFFSRSAEPDYETLLSQLDSSIKEKESHLLSIKLRERRANALFITYGLAAWVGYTLIWYLHIITRDSASALPVIGGPIAIVFTRRGLGFWYKRKQDAEESTLRALKKQQRDKVEELKKKTGYYSTRNLLEKYDEAVKKNEETRRTASGSNTPMIPTTPARPKAKLVSASNPSSPQNLGPAFANAAVLAFPPPANVALLPPAPSGPVHRTLIDKLADALLGVSADEGGPNNKYALICGQCFAHNGLVLKEEFDVIQYQCPRCGFFNESRNPPSARQTRVGSLMDGSASNTPSGSSHRRRVKSMHVTRLPEREEPNQDETEEEIVGDEDQEDLDDSSPVTVISESSNTSKVRQRGEFEMEVDD